jgi:U3 small nucleolar RNA-associated protein 20
VCAQVTKRLRSLCLKRVTEILRKYQKYDFSTFVPALFESLEERIKLLPVQNTQSSVGLMQSFLQLAQVEHLSAYLFSTNAVLPAVFACLSAPKAAVTVKQASLSIAQLLLAAGYYDRLQPYMSGMLSNIQRHMQATESSGGIRASKDPKVQHQMISLLRQQFSVLSTISSHPCEPEQAAKLADLLIPFLAPGRRFGGVAASEEARLFVLKALANLIERVLDKERYAEVVARQLLQPVSEVLRIATGKLVQAVGECLKTVAPLAVDMNTWNKARMDEYDFDKRLAAYNIACNEELLANLHEREMLVLACQCLHDVRDKDFSIRSHASRLGSCIFTVLSKVEGGKQGEDVGAVGSRWRVYEEIMMPTLRRYLKDRDRAIRNDSFKLLITAIEAFPTYHSELLFLRHDDPDQDISKNFMHIQLHRRTKALVRLQACLKDHTVSSSTLRNFLQPIVWGVIIDPQEKDRMKQTDGSYNLSDEGVRTACAIAAQMNWNDYKALLWTGLRDLNKDGVCEKPLIKVVCAVLQAFHFEIVPPTNLPAVEDGNGKSLPVLPAPLDGGIMDGLAGTVPGAGARGRAAADLSLMPLEKEEDMLVEPKEEQDDVLGDDGKGEGEGEGADELEKADVNSASEGQEPRQSADIYTEIVTRLLPALKKVLTEKSTMRAVEGKPVLQGKLRPAIALAMVHVLKQLPKHVLTVQLPHVIGVMCVGLRAREQSERDSVRRALSDIMQCLGPYYLHFVMNEVRTALTKGGYQQHVAGYTLAAVLESVKDQLAGDSLLPCLPLLLRVFEEELLGEVAAEKEVDKLAAKHKETRTTNAYSVFETVGRTLAFEHLPTHVLEPDHDFALRKCVLEASTLKARRKLREALRRLGVGVAVNASLDPKSLLVWTHQQLVRYVPTCIKDKSVDSRAGASKRDADSKDKDDAGEAPPDPTTHEIV